MEQAGMHVNNSTNEHRNNNPNHFIIWLDKHIGKPDECILLKCSLFMAIDPTTGLYEKQLNKDDIDQSILCEASLLVRLDEVEFMFQAFEDVEKCFLTIEKSRHKRIFFITSGSKGRMIVPSLIKNFPGTFVKDYWIYIFCANMNMAAVANAEPPTNTWALEFLDHVLMFNHQDDLMARMVVEIGNYFFTEAKRLDTDNQFDSAYEYYRWSKTMYQRYEIMENRRKSDRIEEIDQNIKIIEERRQEQEDNEDNHVGKAPS
ncbi:unnamed protein product [Rotaria magnacalcarata]|uniref:Uncharacterized protein n=1 Tax=Rotaria magnacalcarata TaxID=392030 RepID=A0A816UQP1_9BILA|nr:unnamed protein product [Rotaria magnacalcarata]CAF2117389.1 unnamed protein product [Rotaria magnacalcarata]CAF3792239.1 unnamed protein product [Rotaria magnacalcarata]